MPDQYRQQQYMVNDWQQRRLQAPPEGYGWYRNDDNQYVLGALATGIIAAVISQAQYQSEYQGARQWSLGERLSSEYVNNGYIISDWRRHNLRRPGWRQEWVQVGNQFVLIKTSSGRILDVVVGSNRWGIETGRDGDGYRGDNRDHRNN
jgi:Ni/Co efflux regulator RcnB